MEILQIFKSQPKNHLVGRPCPSFPCFFSLGAWKTRHFLGSLLFVEFSCEFSPGKQGVSEPCRSVLLPS